MFIQKMVNFHQSENGATAIEYGLIAVLIAVVCIASLTVMGTSIRGFFSSLAPYITS